MTEQPSETVVAACSPEKDTQLEQVTIEVLKAKGSVKTPRKATVIIMQTGISEKYGSVRLACSPNGSPWYVVTERPLEDEAAPSPLRHEREAVRLFAALCEAE